MSLQPIQMFPIVLLLLLLLLLLLYIDQIPIKYMFQCYFKLLKVFYTSEWFILKEYSYIISGFF
jgi:hypothetical protein